MIARFSRAREGRERGPYRRVWDSGCLDRPPVALPVPSDQRATLTAGAKPSARAVRGGPPVGGGEGAEGAGCERLRGSARLPSSLRTKGEKNLAEPSTPAAVPSARAHSV